METKLSRETYLFLIAFLQFSLKINKNISYNKYYYNVFKKHHVIIFTNNEIKYANLTCHFN